MDVAIPVSVLLVSLIGYLRTMRPTFGWGDSSELITAAYHLGIGHSPGYPTWMLLMHPFSRIPIGDVAFRVNFMTALLGAVGVCLLYLVYRIISGSRIAAFVAALCFAFSATFWDITTEAEVYTLHICLAALILLIVLRWRGAPSDKWLYLGAWLIGLSLGNHALTALMIPPLIYLVWAEKGWRFFTGRRVLAAAGLFLLGISVYAYLPIRGLSNPPPHLNNPHSLTDFWRQLTSPGAQSSMFDRGLVDALREARYYVFSRTVVEFGWAGCALAVAGLALLFRRDRRLAIFLISIGLLDVAYSVNFSIFDIYIYYLPLYLALAALMAVGAAGAIGLGAALVDRLPRGAVSRGPALRYGPVAALLLTLPFVQFTGHLGRVDGSDDYSSEQFARAVFGQVEADSMILADWWTIAPLGYLKHIEGERPDVIMFAGPSIAAEEDFVAFATEEFLRGYPAVYFVEMLTQRADLIREKWWLVPEGPVSRVVMDRPDPETLLADIPVVPITSFEDQVAVVGFEREAGELRPGEPMEFTIYWAPLAGYEGQAYKAIFLLDKEDALPIWLESNLLGHDLYPVERWREGEVLVEKHCIYLWDPVPTGEYELLVRVREQGQSACLASDRPWDESNPRDYRLGRIRVGEPEALSSRGRIPGVLGMVRP